jgi:ketoreductase RED1
MSLGYNVEKFTRNLSFEEKLHRAVADADIIQESIPENLGTKQSLYDKLERFAEPSALILSSSATLSASVITKEMKDAGQVLVGHSVDPPHLMPLVEVVPGTRTSKDSIGRAMAFYLRLGKCPVLVNKEVPGFVVNRLHYALLREGIHLVNSGVISVDRLDEAVSASLGPRWAAAGPFKTLALGAGPEGFGHFLEHSGPMIEEVWRGMGQVALDAETTARLSKQASDCYARVPLEDLIKERDEEQIAILNALKKKNK